MASSPLIQNAMTRLGFGKTDGQQGTAEQEGRGPSSKTASKAAELGMFEQRLGRILARRTQDINDNVFVIDLQRCREKFGTKWEKVQDKVHTTVQAILDRRLGPHDLYLQRDDNSYLVVFGEGSARQAQLRCVILGEEVLKRLVGRESVTELVNVKSVEVDTEGTLHLHDIAPAHQVLEQISEDLLNRAPKAETIAPEYSEQGMGTGFEDVRFIYRPMLAVRTKIISTFICLPIRKMHGNYHVSGYDLLGQGAFAKHFLDLDRLTVRSAGNDLRNLRQSGAKSLIAIPVHYETLADSRRRSDYVNLCASEFAGLADRLVFEIVGLPEGIPQVRLTELVSLLRPHGRAIIARFPPDHRNFTFFRISGLHAVGVDLYNIHQREENLMRDIDEFAQAANKNSLKTYALGVRSISMYTAVVAGGFDYAAGHALTSAAETPENAYVYRMESPYLAVLDPAAGDRGQPTFEDRDDVLGGNAD